MPCTTYEQRRQCENLPRHELEALQLAKLNDLCARLVQSNSSLAERLRQQPLPFQSLAEFRRLPLMTKSELSSPSTAPYASNLTFPLDRYVRFHRTSGTHGQPLTVLDTREDWQWWIDTWQFVLDAAELTAQDRVLLAFSFGPFIGFWTAFDAVIARGALVIPGGGLNSLARLEILRAHRVTILLCTPSYALHLHEVAQEQQIDTAALGVRRIIVAGEPGGSSPGVRDRIERAWGARVIDHAGATEIGPWGYADDSRRGLRVVESEFIAEFLALETQLPAREGELSELVLTTIARPGCPVLRYRTGDLVRPSWPAGETNQFVILAEGVLGRVDDMVIVRGVNVFPGALESILREFPEIAEFRITATKRAQLDELLVEIEDRLQEPQRIARELQLRLGLRAEVRTVPLGSLPRYEGKAKRFVDLR